MNDTADMKQLIGEVRDMCGRANEAAPPLRMQLPAFPDHVSPMWFAGSKELKMVEAPLPPRKYVAADVGDMVRLVNEFAGRLGPKLVMLRSGGLSGTGDPAPAKPDDDVVTSDEAGLFVWVFQGLVVAVLDERGSRRERITLKLATSDGWDALNKADGQWISQKEMLELLRTGINGQYVPSNIVPLIRSLKFSSNSEGKSEIVGAGRANLGKSIEAAVAGAEGDIPDDMAITLPLYDDFLNDASKVDQVGPELFTVNCSFDADPEKLKLKIDTKAGEIARVQLEADTRLMQRLASGIKAGNVRIFRGKPE